MVFERFCFSEFRLRLFIYGILQGVLVYADPKFSQSENVAVAAVPFTILTESCCGCCVSAIFFCARTWNLQNVLVAPTPLRFRCRRKSIEIVDVFKTNGNTMILHDFCVDIC